MKLHFPNAFNSFHFSFSENQLMSVSRQYIRFSVLPCTLPLVWKICRVLLSSMEKTPRFRQHRRMVVLDCKDIITGFSYYFFVDCLLTHHRACRDYRILCFQHVKQLRTGCYLVLFFRHSFFLPDYDA